MAEALWVQASGVSYTDVEDRHLIAAVFTQGVIGTGMTISAGVGFTISVSSGYATVSDGTGGMYLAYLDTGTTVSLSAASTTYTIYLRVNRGTAAVDFVGLSTGTPSSTTYAFISIGTATTGASSVTSVTNPASRQASLRGASSAYLPLTGGTVNGSITADSLRLLYGMNVSGVSRLNNGVLLGPSATNALLRCNIRAALSGGTQLISPGSWTTVNFDTVNRNVNDYGTGGYSTSTHRFTAPVSGTYALSGHAHFQALSGTTNASRASRIVSYDSAGSIRWIKRCTDRAAGGNQDWVTFDGVIDTPTGGWFEFQVWHNEASAIRLSSAASATAAGTYSAGDVSYACMTLMTVD